jgi:hypothetical protein
LILTVAGGRKWPPARTLIRAPGYALSVAETTQSLDQRLEEIGAQLAWVRDYL